MNQFQLVCKCTLLFVYLFPTPSKTSAFYFLTLVLGVCEMRKKRSVWISVLCQHKFYLLQLNSSEMTSRAICTD